MKSRLYVALGLCLLTLLAYSNSFSTGFALDNRGLIVDDTRIREASSENLAKIFEHTYWWPYGESGLYRPLTTLSYLFNYSTLGGGTSPAGYHWLNFLLHAGNVLLVYALALRLGALGWRPAWIAAVWAVHPLLTESVTNIVGRADLLAGAAVLGGLLVYLKSTEAEGARQWGWLLLLALVTAAGVFAKESAVTVIGVVVLYEAIFWQQRRQARGLLLGSIAMLIPIQLMLYQRAAVLFASQATTFPFYDNPITGAGWLAGRLIALKVMGQYLGLLAWPARLSSDYSWAQIPLALGSAADFGWWLLLAAVTGATAFFLRRNRTGLFLAGAAFLVFLPTSNLLFAIGTVKAERFLYLPAIAFAAAVVALAYRVPQRAVPVVLAVIVAAFAARTFARNPDWQDDLTLGEATVAAVPASYKSHKLLANALFESHAPIERVLAEAEKSLAILAPLPDLLNNGDTWMRAANWHLAKKDPADARRALEILQRCLAIVTVQEEEARKRPDFDPANAPLATARAEVNRVIASAYLQLGQGGQALEVAERALTLDAQNPAVWREYARTLAAAGRGEDAIIALMEGVMITVDPGLRQDVVDMYRSSPGQGGCALLPGQGGNPALNPSCATVHAVLCRATAGAIKLRVQTGRPDLAEQLRGSGLRDFHCSPTDLP
jgi:protein O-mannosyl-transferase